MGLLELPAEMRNAIYSYYFEGYLFTSKRTLLLVCKQVYGESRPIAYSKGILATSSFRYNAMRNRFDSFRFHDAYSRALSAIAFTAYSLKEQRDWGNKYTSDEPFWAPHDTVRTCPLESPRHLGRGYVTQTYRAFMWNAMALLPRLRLIILLHNGDLPIKGRSTYADTDFFRGICDEMALEMTPRFRCCDQYELVDKVIHYDDCTSDLTFKELGNTRVLTIAYRGKDSYANNIPIHFPQPHEARLPRWQQYKPIAQVPRSAPSPHIGWIPDVPKEPPSDSDDRIFRDWFIDTADIRF